MIEICGAGHHLATGSANIDRPLRTASPLRAPEITPRIDDATSGSNTTGQAPALRLGGAQQPDGPLDGHLRRLVQVELRRLPADREPVAGPGADALPGQRQTPRRNRPCAGTVASTPSELASAISVAPSP